MNETQKKALAMMAEKNVGAIFVAGGPNNGWVFPCRIREDADLAEKVIALLSK